MKVKKYDFVLFNEEHSLNLLTVLCSIEEANLCVCLYHFERRKRYKIDFDNRKFIVSNSLKDKSATEEIYFADCDRLRFVELCYKSVLCDYLEEIGDKK